MNTLTKLVLGKMGQLRPKSANGDVATSILLSPPEKRDGFSLMEAMAKRQSFRDFAPDPLSVQLLSNLLWAAYGMNRADGGRTFSPQH